MTRADFKIWQNFSISMIVIGNLDDNILLTSIWIIYKLIVLKIDAIL